VLERHEVVVQDVRDVEDEGREVMSRVKLDDVIFPVNNQSQSWVKVIKAVENELKPCLAVRLVGEDALSLLIVLDEDGEEDGPEGEHDEKAET